jgi:hypothetical protein
MSVHDARALAEVARVLGHVKFFKAIKLTVHQAEAFTQF